MRSADCIASTDGGVHWKKVLFDKTRPNDVGAVDVAIDPKNARVLYAAVVGDAAATLGGLRAE